MTKVAVVGGGILGLSIAFDLLEKYPGQVVHVYPSSRGGTATRCAGAMLNSFAEIDKYSLNSSSFMSYFALSYEATRMWPDFERRLINAAGVNLPKGCGSCQVFHGGCFGRGTYVVNNTASDSLDDDNFESIITALREFNESHEEVDPRSIPGYLPDQRVRALRAVKIHNEGWLNPNLVTNKLENLLIANDRYQRIDDFAEKILTAASGAVVGIECRSGVHVEADKYVIAAGYDSSALLDRSGLSESIGQRIFSGVGVSIELQTSRSFGNCIRTPNRGGACGIYTVPYFWGPSEPPGRVLVGASNYISTEPRFFGRSVSISHLLDAATREINQEFYSAEVVSINVGNRPTTFDQYPLIGKTSLPELFFVSGTKRDGFHLAPVISEYMGLLLNDRPIRSLADSWNRLDPTRRPSVDISIEDSIDMNVESLISEAYQHGYVPATVRGREQFARSLREDVVRVHERACTGGSGIPPLMFKLLRDSVIEYPS
jgi:glycine oxidase